MFGGSTSNEGVWGFAALAQGVKGLGLGPGDVGGSVKPADFGGWRSKADGEPDSPEGKGAATDVPVVEEAQVGRLLVKLSRVLFCGRRCCQGFWCKTMALSSVPMQSVHQTKGYYATNGKFTNDPI